MKQILIIALTSICLISCTNTGNNNDKTNLELVRKYMNAVETNNIEEMSGLLADTYKGYGPSDGDSTNKEQAIQNWKHNIDNLYESVKYSRFQNLAVTVKEGEEAEAGEWVSNWAYVTIKYKDGRGPVHVWLNAVYKIENGKIAHSRTFYNEADVLRQLGYEFTPPVK